MTIDPSTESQAGAASGAEAGVTPEEALPPATQPALEAPAETLGGYVRRWWQGVLAGELGSMPIVVGLVIIAIVFGLLDDTFFTECNFTNLLLQMAAIATIAIGVVFVLLIGEIDLSVAFVSAVGGVTMTLLLRPDASDWPWWLAIAVALAVTTAIGLVQALVITKAGVPSFVVTLAGLFVLSGVVVIFLTEYSTSGTVRIQNDTVVGIANNFLSDAEGWVVGAVALAGYALTQAQTARSRRARGLDAKPGAVIVLQVAGLAAITFAAVGYADRVRITVFMIAGFMAGLGGIILASRLRSVATNTGGGNLLLNVIAAAVIGGTSLFGGRGRVVSALLGATVIIAIENGMGLLNLATGTKFVITGLVLLGAVLVDALSTRRRAARGVV